MNTTTELILGLLFQYVSMLLDNEFFNVSFILHKYIYIEYILH